MNFLFSLKEFLPLSFMKVRNVEKKIFSEHRSLMGTSEIDSKYKYVKLARGLPTFGVHFFLVKVRVFAPLRVQIMRISMCLQSSRLMILFTCVFYLSSFYLFELWDLLRLGLGLSAQ